MSKKRAPAQKDYTNIMLIVQLLFTAFAFSAMVGFSYFFMSKDVRENLMRNAESVLDFVGTQAMSDMLEQQIILSGFAQSVRSMILHGNVSASTLQIYTRDVCNYYTHLSNIKHNHSGLYGYIENYPGGGSVVLNGVHKILPDDIFPADYPWYQAAIAAGGKTAETISYGNGITDDIILTYSRCIYDDKGDYIGVLCIDVETGSIMDKVVNSSLTKNGFGMLASPDLTIVAHVNPDFVRKSMTDVSIPLSVVTNDLLRYGKILEKPFTNYRGEETISFFRRLPNGWYLGLLAKKDLYYKNMYNMALTLSLLGFLSAATLIVFLINTNKAKSKSDMQSMYKSAFLANMSHELRTPLSAVIGMTAIGKNSDSIERKDYCFSKIENASKHLLGVINDVLDMSKIEANKFELSPVEFSFEKMLQRVADFIDFRISEKRQEFTVRIDKTIPKNLIGDDQRIAQVITNLLSNAIKFTPENGAIRLGTRFLGEENGVCTIQVQVTDAGIGINRENQTMLFKPFQQAEMSTTRKFGGTGLGLSISKSIVEMMDGKIWVDSEPGKGSTFSFTIKLKRGENEVRENELRGVNWNNVKILVVDDDFSILAYFREILQEFGINCDIAKSGREALEMAQKNGAYNFYFVDWRMPEIDGIKLTEKLREGGHIDREKTVVIMITSAELSAIEEAAKEAGINKFLTKPLFPSAIMNVLNEFLETSKKADNESSKTKGIFIGYNVLLAEDVKVNAEILLALFEPTLLKIDCAENGLEALEKFAESPDKYDLIFMDLQMPEMDGYEATKRIRALKIDKAKSIPIIAMTANVFKEDIEKCLSVGMNDHVGKPIDFDEVLEKTRKYLPKKNID